MRALVAVRNVPTRIAVRVQTAGSDAGMTTAEYAVGTVAACGFSGVLYKLLESEEVRGLLLGAISRAFKGFLG